MRSDQRPERPAHSSAGSGDDWLAASDTQRQSSRRAQPRSDRLDLDLDDRLPWLEADGEVDEGSGGGRLIVLLLIVAFIAALVAGGAWWLNGAAGRRDADGSLVRAEPGPYKVRPENPGGKTFAGTGDSAYAVSEGERRGAGLAARDEAPQNETPEAAAGPSAAAQGSAVQVGAYMDREAAEAAWAGLVQRTPLLSGYSHRVVEGRADIGTLYRLQVVAGSPAAAQQLCAALRDAGQDCRVRR